ncbi:MULTISPECIES: RIO1 family regulatory kinase/ATPase domain-containing protein [Gracilibacillus]|uniref:RIO1 family regulatory kinase/ATPase domain-containing protein n=1 Tax=Gracilibacillus TaxID=74385 RepID=UPI0008247208|nr:MULTISPECIES: RIO1 family regulatory kinase/ATPase [Gracilibacillus]
MEPTKYERYTATVSFTKSNRRIKVRKHHPDLQLYGLGRSAAIFKINNENKIIKVFHPTFEHAAEQEKQNYEKLQGNHYYPVVYESGSNYLVMEYIEGKTFFECLATGIPLKPHYMKEVDQGLQTAKEAGLNPSDIHLHNLIVNKDGEVRIIDVARFSQSKVCTQWDDLKRGYMRLYCRPFFPKKVPKWIMYTTAKLYRLYHKWG